MFILNKGLAVSGMSYDTNRLFIYATHTYIDGPVHDCSIIYLSEKNDWFQTLLFKKKCYQSSPQNTWVDTTLILKKLI